MRHVKYGKFEELFVYEKPLFYNLAPIKNNLIERNNENSRRNDNLYYSRLKINRLVLANTNWEVCAPRFVTFTFAKNITDLKEANIYWQSFTRKFRQRFGNIKYLGVVEFQKRGAVHYHVLFFDLKYTVGIKEIIKDMWGQGFIKFKSARKIEKIEHLGLYLAKYLQKDIMDTRLNGQKAFFTSKNLIQPVVLRNMEVCEKKLFDMIEKGANVVSYQSSHFGKITKYQI